MLHVLGLHSSTPPEKLSEQLTLLDMIYFLVDLTWVGWRSSWSPPPCQVGLSNKATSDATLAGLSVGWTQDGHDYGFYATVYCCEQDTLDTLDKT